MHEVSVRNVVELLDLKYDRKRLSAATALVEELCVQVRTLRGRPGNDGFRACL